MTCSEFREKLELSGMSVVELSARSSTPTATLRHWLKRYDEVPDRIAEKIGPPLDHALDDRKVRMDRFRSPVGV